MKPEIVMPGPMLDSCMAALDDAFTVHKLWQAPDQDALLAEVADRVRGVATGKGCSGDLMRALPKLEIVASFGVGYDSVDVETAKAQGVRVTNTPDVLNDAVAELCVGLMVALARRIPQADVYTRQGRWAKDGAYPLQTQLTGATVGIMGLGRIGKEIARRLEAMRMTVVYNGRNPQSDVSYKFYNDLTAMARDVDWLVSVTPLTPQTEGAVNAEVIAALGPKGHLVNVGRGPVVDEAALLKALQAGEIAGAALDVFDDEPNPSPGLLTLENVVLTPHVASATNQTRWAMGDCVVRNLKAHFAGEPLISPVA